MAVDFFVVGAPKCATTSLYEYFRQVEGISMCTIKEPFHFCDDFHFKNERLLDQDEYLSLFEFGENKVYGDVSVWNLYSKNAADNIYRLNPRAKIVIILRKQEDLIKSLFHQYRFTCVEEFSSLNRSLIHGHEDRDHRLTPFVECLDYLAVTDFLPQVRRYDDRFGSENVYVTWFEDLKSDFEEEFGRILKHVGIANDVSDIKFVEHNKKKQNRSYFFKRIVKLVGLYLRKIFGKRQPVGLQIIRRVAVFMLKLNSVSFVGKDNCVINDELTALMSGRARKFEKYLCERNCEE